MLLSVPGANVLRRLRGLRLTPAREVDKASLLKLLEIRILAVTVVAGFVLTNLRNAPSEAQQGGAFLPYLNRWFPLNQALVIHSGFTLFLLLLYALIDLFAIHCMALGDIVWAVRAYKLNIAFAVFPFVYGMGIVFVLSAAAAVPGWLSYQVGVLVSDPRPLLLELLAAIVLGFVAWRRIEVRPSYLS
jgi:hypothetical protein